MFNCDGRGAPRSRLAAPAICSVAPLPSEAAPSLTGIAHRPRPGEAISDLPLAVDLDGTVILTDMSYMTISRVLLIRPWLVPWMLYKEFSGRRSVWKRTLGERLNFDPEKLTYHEEFLRWLKQQKEGGRILILCTASDRPVAEKIARHIGIFDDVMATDLGPNLAGENKAAALVERFGEKGFGYAGNSKSDLAVWPHAGEVIVVNAKPAVRRQIEADAHLIFD